jgi:hypothetical protein
MGRALKAVRGVLQGHGADRRVLYYNDVVRIRSILTHPCTELSWCGFVKFKEVARAHDIMVCWGVMLSEVVS